MSPSSQYKKQHDSQCRGCKALYCCSSRFSILSSEDSYSVCTERYASVSSLAHAMVQERLDQMIWERKEARRVEEEMRRRRKGRWGQESKFVVMMAMEKPSYDPRRDFRDSIVDMIKTNGIRQPKDLRTLLDCYLSVNSDECRELILDVFHEVCSYIFL